MTYIPIIAVIVAVVLLLAARRRPNGAASVRFISLAVLGGAIGYYAGVVVACLWLWPTSNLCGFVGVFVTGPIGVIVGSVVGWRLQHRSP